MVIKAKRLGGGRWCALAGAGVQAWGAGEDCGGLRVHRPLFHQTLPRMFRQAPQQTPDSDWFLPT